MQVHNVIRNEQLGVFCLLAIITGTLLRTEAQQANPNIQNTISKNHKELENKLNEADTKLSKHGTSLSEFISAGYGSSNQRIQQRLIDKVPDSAKQQFNIAKSQMFTKGPRLKPQSRPSSSFPIPVYTGINTLYHTAVVPVSYSVPPSMQFYSLSIQTKNGSKEVTDWYRKQLPATGWKVKEQTKNSYNYFSSAFQGSKGALQGNIAISGDSSQCHIHISAYNISRSSPSIAVRSHTQAGASVTNNQSPQHGNKSNSDSMPKSISANPKSSRSTTKATQVYHPASR